MPDEQHDLALAHFQATHGGEWWKFMNSRLWKDARAFLNEFGPNRKMTGLTPGDMVSFGTVFTAQVAGWQDCLQTMEGLLTPPGGLIDPTYNPTYEPEASLEPPPPAPEAPRVNVPPPKARHRKDPQKPKSKK